jgi:RNA polymerase primary sigma factor
MRSDQENLDLFRLYLDEVGRHPLLTGDEEIHLAQTYEAGVDAQLKLADTSPTDPARPDLEAVAEHGERATWACCGRWRSSTGARASSSPPTPPGGSARPSPAGPPTMGPGRSGLPVHVDEQVGRLRRTQTRLHELLGREPSDAELAAELDMPTDKVVQLKDTAQAVTSLDAPVGEDGAALGDFLKDDSAVGPRRAGR